MQNNHKFFTIPKNSTVHGCTSASILSVKNFPVVVLVLPLGISDILGKIYGVLLTVFSDATGIFFEISAVLSSLGL